jgi:uncharacterized protein (DUF1330 family)
MTASVVFMGRSPGKAGCRHGSATGAKRNGEERPVLDVGHCAHLSQSSTRLMERAASIGPARDGLCERQHDPLSSPPPGERTSALMEIAMAKAYWIAFYRSISNPDALAAYAKLAGPAIAAAGGRFLARGNAAKAYEAGVAQRVVVIEFDSVEKAVAAHDSEGYQAALKVFGKAAERDMRIVEGLA